MGKKKSKQIFERSIGKKAIAWVLVFSIFFQTLTVSAQEVFEESPNPILEETETEVEENTGQPEQIPEEQQNVTDLYENGVIKIYHSRQLEAIGTGAPVRIYDMQEEQFGTGEEVLSAGQVLTYAPDARYMLMNEISLSSEIYGCCRKDLPGHLQKLRKKMQSYMKKKVIRFMCTITISFV